MSLIASLLWGLLFWIYMWGVMPLWIPYFLLRALQMKKIALRYFTWLHHFQCQLIVRTLWTDVRIHNIEKVPMDRPICYIGNHQGYVDILVLLGWLPKTPGFIGKGSLLWVPVVNFWMLMNGSLFLDRKNLRKGFETIMKGADQVRSGRPMVIFPEGGRNKGGEMKPFKKGSFKLAFQSEADIVPFTIEGSADLLEKTGRVRMFQRIDIWFHDPVPTLGLGKTAQEETAAQVETTIRSGIQTIKALRERDSREK